MALNRQVPAHILPLVQYADDIQPVTSIADVDHVRSGGILQIARPHVDRPAQPDPGRQAETRIPYLIDVTVRLIRPPASGARASSDRSETRIDKMMLQKQKSRAPI
jgi:hypothetical protein